MRNLIHDLRVAGRSLAARPGFTVIVVLTLALGIGANTAIFTVVNGVLFRPLPYRDPGRLAMVWSQWTNFAKTWVADGEYLAYQGQKELFSDVGAWGDDGHVAITGDAAPESVPAIEMTANLIGVLGVAPAVGRVITPEEDLPNGPRVVILGHELWKRRYGADPAVVGRTILLDGEGWTVVGVMPAGFRLPLDFQRREPAQLFVPVRFDRANATFGNHSYYAIGRLRPGVTIDRVNSEIAALAKRWTTEGKFPAEMRFTAFAVGLDDQVNGGVRRPLLVLLGSVGLLLLLACANVANLLLVRAEGRTREIAVRAALGAGGKDLIRLAMTECLLLALSGGAVGLALAAAGVRVLAHVAPASVPRIADLGVDGPMLLIALLLAVVTGIGCGLIPALRGRRPDLVTSLRDGGRTGSQGRERRRGRDLLVAGEMAVAVILVIGSALTFKSFRNLLRIDPGFDSSHALTLKVALPTTDYPDDPKLIQFFDEVAHSVRALPGVTAAGFVRVLPIAEEIGDAGMQIEGKLTAANEPNRSADWQVVTPGYFEAMKMRLVDGRFFTDGDGVNAPPVIAVNETLVREYFPGENPLGRRIQVGGPNRPWRTIVAVVGDVRHNGLTNVPKREWFIPHAQFGSAFGSTRRAMTLVARTTGDPAAMIPAVSRVIHDRDPNLPLTGVGTLDDVLGGAVKEQQFTALLMAGMALLTLALATVGIYGVMSYSVTERTQEIGVRLALGAAPGTVRLMVVGQGMAPALAGIGVGLVAAAGLVQLLAGILYGMAPRDPVVFSVIPTVLAAVALGSALIPASRATRVDPLLALRRE